MQFTDNRTRYLSRMLESNQLPLPASGASFVSPQTCNLQLSVVATQLNLNVVSASGRLQQSHTATRIACMHHLLPCRTGLYYPIA